MSLKIFTRVAGCLSLLLLIQAGALAQTGAVKGRIVVRNGDRLEPPNQRIRIHLSGDYEIIVARTEKDGTFVVPKLKVGKWLIKVMARDYKQEGVVFVSVFSRRTTEVTPSPIIITRVEKAAGTSGPRPSRS